MRTKRSATAPTADARAKADRLGPDTRRVDARGAEIEEAPRRLKRKLAEQDARIAALDVGATDVVDVLARMDSP